MYASKKQSTVGTDEDHSIRPGQKEAEGPQPTGSCGVHQTSISKRTTTTKAQKDIKSCYDQVWDGEWWPVPNELDLACCDCGLVHRVQFRRRKGKLEAKFIVNRRSTGQLRRRHHAKGAHP
jgi:hypothetical protein